MINTVAKSDLERKDFLSVYTSRSVHHRSKSGQEVKAGAWKLELKEKPWRNAAYRLAFIYHPGPLLRGGTAHSHFSGDYVWVRLTKANLNS